MLRQSFFRRTTQLPAKSRSCYVFLSGIASRPAIQRFDDEENSPIHGRRWQIHENLTLIAGKVKQEDELVKVGETDFERTTKETWEKIAVYCQENGVSRTPQQCRDKWQRILAAYSKIKDWEVSRPPGKKSFWAMKINERNAEGLSFRLDNETYKAMELLQSLKEATHTVNFMNKNEEVGGFSSTIEAYEPLNPIQQIINTPNDEEDDRPALIASTIKMCLNQLKHIEFRIFQHDRPCTSDSKNDDGSRTIHNNQKEM